jgi:hypothetical protein
MAGNARRALTVVTFDRELHGVFGSDLHESLNTEGATKPRPSTFNAGGRSCDTHTERPDLRNQRA